MAVYCDNCGKPGSAADELGYTRSGGWRCEGCRPDDATTGPDDDLDQAREAAGDLNDALQIALAYVEDVLSNPEQLACFKKGVVQGHVKTIRAALRKANGPESGF